VLKHVHEQPCWLYEKLLLSVNLDILEHTQSGLFQNLIRCPWIESQVQRQKRRVLPQIRPNYILERFVIQSIVRKVNKLHVFIEVKTVKKLFPEFSAKLVLS